MESHLSDCEACALRYRTLEGVAGAVRDVEMNPFTKRRIAAAAADFRRPSPSAFWRAPLFRIAAPVVAAAAVVCTLIAAWVRPVERSPLSTENSKPSVSMQIAPRPSEPMEATMFVDHGRREIALFPGTSIYLSDDAIMETRVLSDTEARFSLLGGSAAVEIGGHEPDFRFVLSLPNGEAEARGTVFFASVGKGGADALQVMEGVVEVRGDAGRPSVVITSSEGVVAGNGAFERSTELHLVADEICLMKGCAPLNPLAKANGDKPSDAKKVKPAAAIAAESALEAGRLDDALGLVDTLPTDAGGKVSAVYLLSRLARAYRSAKKFDEARNVYLKLISAFPKTEAAADSLVALGQLESSALRRQRDALSRFDRYLAEYPAGVLAKTAAAERIRLLESNGSYRALIVAADDYIAKYKEAFGIEEVRRRRADALARTGRCPEAVAEYQRIIDGHPGTSEADRAKKGISSCR